MVQTEDESFAELLVVDTKTLAMREAGELNFFSSPLVTKSGGEEIDPFHGLYLLLKDAPELPLPHGNDWTIADFKSDGPAKLPAVKIPQAREKQPELWVDDAGAKYLAAKMGQHAGGRFPALDAGRRGTHFFELTGEKASRLSELAGGFYRAKSDVFVVALETNKEHTLHPVTLVRANLGKDNIGVTAHSPLTLDKSLVADLLTGARELPVTGRVQGFSVQELSSRAAERHVIGADEHRLPIGTAADPARSPLATRLGQLTGDKPALPAGTFEVRGLVKEKRQEQARAVLLDVKTEGKRLHLSVDGAEPLELTRKADGAYEGMRANLSKPDADGTRELRAELGPLLMGPSPMLHAELDVAALKTPAKGGRFGATDLPAEPVRLWGNVDGRRQKKPAEMTFAVQQEQGDGKVEVAFGGRTYALERQADGSYEADRMRLSAERPDGRRELWADMAPPDLLGTGRVFEAVAFF